MCERIQKGGLQIAAVLHDLPEQEIAPGTGVPPDEFWAAFEAIVTDLRPRNRQLLAERDAIQTRIDAWHRDHPGADFDRAAYKAFLQDIFSPSPTPSASPPRTWTKRSPPWPARNWWCR